ncbi:MAG: hypothetical protein HYX80_06585 [Chloroflexi bacterium]|nr:hypothetical protein [Chloroflexota bacterium]
MSKFIDRLNRLSRGETPPMGFTAKQAASAKPKIQVVASLSAEDAEKLTGHLSGADAGLVGIAKPGNGAEALQKLSKSSPDIIWGGQTENIAQEKIEQVAKAGGDFIVFSAVGTPLTLVKNDKETGKILEVSASLTEGLLRTANELPVDAVLTARDNGKNKALTWQDLMLFRRFADLLNKPLLVPVPLTVTAGELEALWEAGISAVVIDVDANQPADALARLRQEIDKVEFPSRRAKRAEVIAPRIGLQPGRPPRKEDEEEEEEDY